MIDDQLQAIKDQDDKQLDLIGKNNIERTGGIKFENEKNKELAELAGEIKKGIENIIKKRFVHSAYNKTTILAIQV